MTRTTTSIQVPFDGSSSAKVLIEMEPGVSFNLGINVRVYPAASAPVVHTPKQASLRSLGNRTLTITEEEITFENSVTAETKYPVSIISSIEELDGFLFTVDPVTKAATEVSVTLAYTGNTTRLKATNSNGEAVKVTGVIKVSYITDYSLWEYKPQVSRIGGVTTTTYGSVYAYYLGAVGSLDINAEAEQGLRYTEVYRVFFLVAVDDTYKPESVWHYPTNWPKASSRTTADLPEPSYGGLSASSGPNPLSTIIQRRVVEVGYVNPMGYENVETVAQPGVFPFYHHNYTQYYWQFQETLPAGYEEAQRNISKSDISDRVNDTYSRVIEI